MALRHWLLLGPLALACTSPTDAELLAGKKCTAGGRCAPGYVCVNHEDCVPTKSVSTGGATGGSAANGGDESMGGEAGLPDAGGSSGSTARSGGTGGSSGSSGAAGGAAPPGGASSTGGAAGGAPPTAGTAGAAGDDAAGGTGGILCSGSTTDCFTLATALRHRYRFDGTGTTVVDSIGGADGTVRGGATLSGTGSLNLSGFGQYVDLPNGILSELVDATIEGWVTWQGGSDWQRIFDFGDAMAGYQCTPNGLSAGEGVRGVCGRSYLVLSPRTDQVFPTESRLAFVPQPESDTSISASALPVGETVHFAVVADDTGNQLELYLDGALVGSADFTDKLSDINDINNWLGQSQWEDDPNFRGSYTEFRIYAAALTASQIGTSFAEGPDPSFLE